MRLDERFLKTAVPTACVIQGNCAQELTYAVDTRSLKVGQLFFALPGARVDGHIFLKDALEKSSGVVIAADRKHLLPSVIAPEKLVITVEDPLQALVALATAWRARFSYPVAAVTGSIGKTSTKEITAHFLACAGKKYLVSRGNLNTVLGVAMTISHMDDSYEGALFEVGINARGEMDTIIQMLNPTTGIITCIAHSHLEGLGSLADIAMEKRALFKKFTSENIGIVSGDFPLLSAVSYCHPVIRFGFKTINQVQARKLVEKDGTLSFVLKLYDHKYPITVTKTHRGFVNNILAAATLAHRLGVSDEVIVEGIRTLPACAQRYERCRLKDFKGILIDDCYNASPESMKAALLAFESEKGTGKKIAVLGDMLELGQNSSFWHRQIGRFLRRVTTLQHLILVGDQVKWIEKTAPQGITIEKVASWQDAVSKLSATLEDHAVVLVKGSRGIQLQNVVAKFVDKQVCV
jgi:UDP-N-acetylmuramoyl-tripeptide--D-alanyl-D-alanine ligase